MNAKTLAPLIRHLYAAARLEMRRAKTDGLEALRRARLLRDRARYLRQWC